MQRDRRADGETERQSETHGDKERTSVLVPEGGIRFPETCFPDLGVLFTPHPLPQLHTHTHTVCLSSNRTTYHGR